MFVVCGSLFLVGGLCLVVCGVLFVVVCSDMLDVVCCLFCSLCLLLCWHSLFVIRCFGCVLLFVVVCSSVLFLACLLFVDVGWCSFVVCCLLFVVC